LNYPQKCRLKIPHFVTHQSRPKPRGGSISANVKIELDDGLESLGGGAVTKAVGQGVAPGGVFGLQGEQFGDGVVPSLRSGASVRRTAIADGEWRLLGLPAGAISGLSFGVAEGVVTYRLAASWHGVFSVT
jgi:hypothetical protein